MGCRYRLGCTGSLLVLIDSIPLVGQEGIMIIIQCVLCGYRRGCYR